MQATLGVVRLPVGQGVGMPEQGGEVSFFGLNFLPIVPGIFLGTEGEHPQGAAEGAIVQEGGVGFLPVKFESVFHERFPACSYSATFHSNCLLSVVHGAE